MSLKLSPKASLLSIIAPYIIAFLVVIVKPIEIVNDSEGYLNMVITRSAGYPLFLYGIKLCFGAFFNTATIILQYGLGVCSIYFFIKTLKTCFNLHAIWLFLLNIILLAPYFYNHHLANVFLSEALSYPIYLIVVGLMLRSLTQKDVTFILYAIPLLLLLIQTRSQFLFLIPIIIGIILWNHLLKYKGLLFLLIIFPFLCGFADKLYHKVAHDEFVSTPWTGIHLLTPAMYVSDASDYNIYNSQKAKALFKNSYKDLAKKHLNIHELNPNLHHENDLSIYVKEYSEIANFTILPNGLALADSLATHSKKLIEVDVLTKQMSIPLIINNFKAWLSLYIKNFIHAFGNAKYTLLLVIILGFSCIKAYQTNEIKYVTISCIVLLSLSNVALVAIGMHTLKRFTFYNDWVWFLIFILLIHSGNKTSKYEL